MENKNSLSGSLPKHKLINHANPFAAMPFCASAQGILDTLVQNGTARVGNRKNKPQLIVAGEGTEIQNTVRLKGWAKRKIITQKMMLSLVDVAKEKGKSDQIKAYWNTYHCISNTQSYAGKLYGKYCKNRFCTLCLCIRKAEIINKYLPVLKEWKEPHFVTLTIRSIKAYRLNVVMGKMVQGLQRIKNKYRKRNSRDNSKMLIGIRSLECNFNPLRKSYNPHFHILVPDKETALILIDEWTKLWTAKWTNKLGQHYRKVESLERDLIECIKYGSKIFTEPDLNKKAKKQIPPKIYVSALDNILTAMKGHRLFDRFGFNLPANVKVKTISYKSLMQYDEWVYDSKNFDWLNTETQAALAGFKLSAELHSLLENNIDVLNN